MNEHPTDYTDLVHRLHILRATAPKHSPTDRICKEAAVAIEEQAARIAEALAWLRQGDGASAISALRNDLS